MTLDDLYVIVAVRQRDALEVVDGSVAGACQFCSAAVWLAPSSIAMRASSTAAMTVLCMSCAKTLAEGIRDFTVAPLTPAQVKEINNHDRRRQTDS